MYADHPPVPNAPVVKVLVIEEGDKESLTADQVMEEARGIGAVTEDDGEIFWFVFVDEPRRMWDMTETVVRGEFNKATSETVDAG